MHTQIMKKQLTSAYRYSMTRLALNYYTYYEVSIEENLISSEFHELETQFHRILNQCLEGELSLEPLAALRGEITKSMNTVSTYTDMFLIYEYVFNRMERRFSEDKTLNQSEQKLIQKLMMFLSESGDAVIMNNRLHDIIGELPARFTKKKFFNIIKESLSSYVGSPQSALCSTLYLLRAGALIQVPDTKTGGYETLWNGAARFASLDYQHLTKDQYDEIIDQFMGITSCLTDYSDFCFMLQEMINDLYIMIVAKQYAIVDVTEETTIYNIIKAVLNKFLRGDTNTIEDEITQQLSFLEGKQETFYDKYTRYSLSNTKQEIKDKQMEQHLMVVDRLMSNSPFLSLEPDQTEDVVADEAWVNLKLDEFCSELEQVLETYQKPVGRAVMAKVLSGLPLRFRSIEEIEAYISDSLQSCSDPNEKENSMELLNEIMERENALV